MKTCSTIFLSLLLLTSCENQKVDTSQNPIIESIAIKLDIIEANRLASLPLKCINQPLPYKSGIVIADSSDLEMPQVHHPAFYGCFDWHSAVHGHWSLIYLLKQFPNLSQREEIIERIAQNLTKENIETEIQYFSMNKYSKSFERTYGWAWLLKLVEELHDWNNPNAKQWVNNLMPLAQHISKAYIDYLPKLAYPIRVGEHTNTAFGLSFAYDYALALDDRNLKEIIEKSAKRFYANDQNCPIGWEPSGYDFLSPCLEEINLMKKILDIETFQDWSIEFIPNIKSNFNLAPGKVLDRSDGKLVHLDGLNFSRAWCLYQLRNEINNAKYIADQHMQYSLAKIKDGDYAGEHWLASFALYAYKCNLN